MEKFYFFHFEKEREEGRRVRKGKFFILRKKANERLIKANSNGRKQLSAESQEEKLH